MKKEIESIQKRLVTLKKELPLTYILEVTYQPINKCWCVLYKKGMIVHNEINENLVIALAEMAKFIENQWRDEEWKVTSLYD